jgi:hypothetical protein
LPAWKDFAKNRKVCQPGAEKAGTASFCLRTGFSGGLWRQEIYVDLRRRRQSGFEEEGAVPKDVGIADPALAFQDMGKMESGFDVAGGESGGAGVSPGGLVVVAQGQEAFAQEVQYGGFLGFRGTEKAQ